MSGRNWILAVASGVLLAGLTTAADDDEEQPPDRRRGRLSDEQQAVRQEMLEKYDKNKNGKIDPEERSRITAEDKEKLARVGLGAFTPRRRRDDSFPAVPRSPSPPAVPKTPRK